MEKYESLRSKLEKVIQVAAFIGVALLILSPLIQWGERTYLLITGNSALFSVYVWDKMGDALTLYQEMMRTVESVVSFMAKIIAVAILIYVLLSLKKFRNSWKRCLIAAIPLILFACYSAGIYIVTNIRGAGEFDIIPHYYIGDSIYEFMRHPFTYFFCGIFVLSDKSRKILINLFSLSAMVLNAAGLFDKWVIHNRCFTGERGSAVFNNTNHYCYYLAVTVICAALLFVYEDRKLYKVFHASNMALGMTMMISADSLGPYLAVVCTLVMFAVYCRIHEKERFKWAVIAIGIVFVINVMMSMLVETLLTSLIRTFFDVGRILSDPSGSDEAGSHRWQLWKYAVQHIVKRPLVGWGIEGYEYGGTAHNEILQYTENFGIPVVVLHTAAIVFVLIETFIRKKALPKMTLLCFCCTVSYLISAMFGVAIFYTTPFMYLFLGLTYAETAKNIITGDKPPTSSTESGENILMLKKE